MSTVILIAAIIVTAPVIVYCDSDDEYFQKNRQLARTLVEVLQDRNAQREVLADLAQENQSWLNRSMSLVIKYIVKREVDSMRMRRSDAVGRVIYSNLVMKLIDIAKDVPRSRTAEERIETASKYYMTVDKGDEHDLMADNQVFHQVKRLYDVLLTAPKLLEQLGNVDDLTPRLLVNKLTQIHVQPVHLAVAVLVQYHLRETINFALKQRCIQLLATQPHRVGLDVIDMIKRLAARLLPVSELLDTHLAYSTALFADDCPATWLGIVKPRQS